MKKLVIEVAGIGQATSLILTKHGFKTVADLANASVESLSVVPGFADARSLQTIKKAKDLLQATDVLVSKEVSGSVARKEKTVSKKQLKNKKITKKNKKVEKNKLKLEAKKLAKKVAKLKEKKAAKNKAKKASSKAAAKKKSSKKSKKK